MRRFAVALILLAVGTLCAAPATAQTGASLPIVSSTYELGPQDSIRLEVVGEDSLTGEYRLSDAGALNLPLLGEVGAAGLTARELAELIEQRLEADFVADARVRVQVSEVRSKTISVLGAVVRPGILGYPGEWTLLEALTAAGGLATDRGDTLHVLRRAGNGLSDQISVPIEALLLRGEPRYNLPLAAGDLINVERTRKLSIYLLGEVASPGLMEFESTRRLTLLTAIARAGGLTDRASPKVRIKREGRDDLRDEIRANYKRILGGQDPDVELQDGDVVVVEESFF